MAALLQIAKPFAVLWALVVLTSATAVLVVDYAVALEGAERLAQRLSEAEEAARRDPAAGEALQAEVAQQTARSLARCRRQRITGITALAAAGLWLTLVKWKQQRKATLPSNIADAVSRRATVHPVERESTIDDEPSATTSVDLAPIDALVAEIGREQRHLIPLLHGIDGHYHYLPPTALSRLAERTNIPAAQIEGVASFYSQFRRRPRGEHLVRICRGTACHVSGADRIHSEFRRLLRIPAGGDTDRDGFATVESVGCLGCCTLAPVIRVNDRIVGHAQVDFLPSVVDDMQSVNADRHGRIAEARAVSPRPRRPGIAKPRPEIRVGVGSCCVAGGSRDVLDCLEREVAAQRLDVTIKPVGCVGICHMTPLVEVVTPGAEPIIAARATPADVPKILQALPRTAHWSRPWRNRVANSWRRDDPLPNPSVGPCRICPLNDVQVRRFTDPQVRIVTEHSGLIDPTSLEEYRAHGGLTAWEECLRGRSPHSIIETIERSGLRGRGGGGYPTAAKWSKVRAATGDKYLVCNGDEGDPGAFMDRMIMESYPFRVLEGLAIAAYTVGADRAFIYVRHEYPLAVQRLRHALSRLQSEGLLGDSILGTEFSLQVEVVEGAGAFVCGEETALLQSIMGHRGIPRLRPPYPVERGLFDRPTLVNNVETFANIPWIIRHGPERFAALGTETSKGTKVFSLAGKVRRGGLIEIPMGLTIREVVENIGGGVAEGKRFKAVQIGGPSGGCVPAELADTPMDYEHLHHVGAMVGSGGLVVLDDDDCMVDVARYFLEFTQRESCGHCTFCRVGTRKLLDLLECLCAGKGRPRDLDEIESLSHAVSLGSLCGLGKTAPNPVLSTLKYFRDEYEAHLQGRCPAGRCKSLIRYEVARDCVGCTLCAQHCPVGAIAPTPYRQHVIDADICTRCDACRVTCPEQAIKVV